MNSFILHDDRDLYCKLHSKSCGRLHAGLDGLKEASRSTMKIAQHNGTATFHAYAFPCRWRNGRF